MTKQEKNSKSQQKNIRFNPEEQETLKKVLQGYPGLSLADLVKRELRWKAHRFDRMKALGKIKIVSLPDHTWNIQIQTRMDQECWMYIGHITDGSNIHLDVSEDLEEYGFWPDIKHLFRIETLKELEEVLQHDVPILLPF